MKMSKERKKEYNFENTKNRDMANYDRNLAERKFQEARQQMQKSIEKHIVNYESSSEEEEIESNGIFETILKSYSSSGGGVKDLGRTQTFLEESLLSGAVTCLICICNVKRIDAIWSCTECYTFFHLQCIQRWAKDNIVHQKRIEEDQNPANVRENYNWCCPKCRREYAANAIPNHYLCFCSKQTNPRYHPWLPPHSCGEVCAKVLKPECGHKCLLLCHPGPCPPCPRTVSSSCYCGKTDRPQRCSNKFWSCGSKCDKILSCNRHPCTKRCHAGECPPCPKRSQQKCQCGSETQQRECASPTWKCNKICNKQLSCGNHRCDVRCHSGPCEPCPLTKSRSCPCGKKQFKLLCTEETPTCGDTCGKLLNCGIHQCLQRCHREKCGICLEVVLKTCRCGSHQKELSCHKEFLCDTKCKLIKDCQKHSCNRKCCDGNCLPCEKPCGRVLRCGIHKCTSTCHRGPCYPCRVTVAIKCRCGETAITVPCGKQRRTRPPRCNKPCKIPPDCHHESRQRHRCHFNDCPPCEQICNKQHQNCNHLCPNVCHSAVLVKIVENEKVSMPWEKKGPHLERKNLPCPNCVIPMPVTCLGGHETVSLPCYMAKPSSCHRICGRKLVCGNHICNLECHQVLNAPNDLEAGTNCQICESQCTKTRPEGCSHPCPRECHSGDCPPCKQMLRLKCHCGLNQVYVRCGDWINKQQQESLKSCGNQCPKNYKCGHRCQATCHSNECPDEDKCHKKVKVTCPCKRIKKEFHCDVVRNNEACIDCNAECRKKLEELRRAQQLQEQLRTDEEQRKNQRELEEFQKKFQSKKRHKERKQFVPKQQVSLIRKFWFIIPILLIFIVSLYLLIFQTK